jgi:hypothetical protein
MAREEDDDPAVYGSGRKKDSNRAADVTHGEDADSNSEDEDDDSTLLTVQPGFNRLLVVLRDPGVLHFVKYVSALAPGSRWDICGEWEVGRVDIEEEEEEEEVEEEVMDSGEAKNGQFGCSSEGTENEVDDEKTNGE